MAYRHFFILTNIVNKIANTFKKDSMKKLVSIFLLLTTAVMVNAQTAEESVKATITHFFEGMKKADTVLLKSTLSTTAILQTIKNKNGDISISDESIAAFIAFVGKQQPGAADEQIVFETVKIDGTLASVWTPYKFYFNGKFSHCGVNSFQLVKLGNVWKIHFIIDTRRKDGCE